MNTPIYRANRTDGLGYIEGYLIKQDDSEKFSIVKNFNLSTIYGMVCPHDIDATTLSIHFPDMLDSQGNKIFASLSEDGKGGDILEFRYGIPPICVKAPVKYRNRRIDVITVGHTPDSCPLCDLEDAIGEYEVRGVQE